MSARIEGAAESCHWLNGGQRITGTVTRLTVAGSYRVRLHFRGDGRVLRETFSDDAGAYTFHSLAALPNSFYTVAFDRDNDPLNAAIADLITPEPTP